MNIRRFSRGLIVLSLLGLFIFPLAVNAQHPNTNNLYAVADLENYLVYMPRDGSAIATQIGPLGVSLVEATALSLDGQTLYAANANILGTLNWNTGAFSAIGTFGTGGGSEGNVAFTDVDGLAFDPLTGIFYGTHRWASGAPEDLLFQINPATGAHIPNAFGAGIDYVVIDTFDEVSLYDVDDIAIDPTDGQMYGVVNSSGGADHIVRINKLTGDVEDVGRSHNASGDLNDVEGLAFHNSGAFFGTTGANGAVATNNTMWQINVTNALFTLVSPMGIGSDYEAVAGLIEGSNKINGTVFLDANENGAQDASENGQPDITVKLYIDANNNGVVDINEILADTEITDENGEYNFEVAVQGNFVIVIDTATMPPTSHLTTDNVEEADFAGFGLVDNGNDFGLYFESASIGNYVWKDTDADGIQDAVETGFSYITVNLYKSDGTFVRTTETDLNGLYTFNGLIPGNYYIEIIEPISYQLSPQDATGDALDSDPNPTTGLTAATTLSSGENDDAWDAGLYAPGGTSSIGDYVWLDSDGDGVQDVGEVGLEDVDVVLYEDENNNGVIDAEDDILFTQTTDANGAYNFTSLSPGSYIVNVDETTLPLGVALTTSNEPLSIISLGAGVDYNTADFGYQGDSSIAGYVWDDDYDHLEDTGEGLKDLDVYLYDSNDNLIASTLTDDNGNYLFDNLIPGDYYVEFSLKDNHVYSDQDVGSDDTIDSDPHPMTGRTDVFTLAVGEDKTDVDAGQQNNRGAIGDKVWNDADADGIQDVGEAGLSGVTVQIYDDNDVLLGTTTTDANGEYFFNGINGGTNLYVVFTRPSGYVISNQDAGVNDALDSDPDPITRRTIETQISNGEIDITWDAGMYQAVIIGDFVWKDQDGDGVQDAGEPGIVNVTLDLWKDNNGNGVIDAGDVLVGTTTTDANGAYELSSSTSGDYIVDVTDVNNVLASLVLTGGTDPLSMPGLTVGNEYDTADFGYQGNASIAGYVWDDDYDHLEDTGEGLKDLDVYLYDSNDNLIASTLTDDNGNYLFDELGSGDYYVQFALKDNHVYSDQDVGSDDTIDSDPHPMTGRTDVFTLAVGEDKTDVDAGQQNNRGAIGDKVWNDADADGIQDVGEAGLSGVTVQIYDDNDVLLGTTTTDANGEYFFNGINGGTNLYVVFTRPSGYVISNQDAGVNDALDSDPDPITRRTIETQISNGEIDITWDAGMYQAVIIGDYVWGDSNGDGVQDAGEPGIVNVTLDLWKDNNGNGVIDAGDVLVGTTTTDANGAYELSSSTSGDYIVDVTDVNNVLASLVLTGGTDPLSMPGLTVGNEYDTADFGYQGNASIAGYVWDDDYDHLEDTGEGLKDLDVYLYDSNDNLIASTLTDDNGNYLFDELGSGDYYVQFALKDNHVYSDQDVGSDDTIDSDPHPMTGRTDVFTLAVGEDKTDVDAGQQNNRGAIGDKVWNDADADGIQDVGEAGLSGVTVQIYDDNDVLLGTTTTDANGEYFFNGINGGTNLYVVFTRPSGYVISNQDAGVNDALDSDPDPITRRTIETQISNGEIDITWDAGMYQSASIGDKVWYDADNDGIQDETESGLPGVVVELYYSDGTFVGTEITGDGGYYGFTDLRQGDYYLKFLPLSGYSFSPQNATGDALDSDANTSTGQTAVTTLAVGESDLNWDAGLYRLPASLGNYVWFDDNNDGIQDGSESGLLNVKVNLYEKDVHTTVNYSQNIQTGTDDAHQEGTSMKLTNNDLLYGKTNRTTGFRFTNLNIPEGAIINSAYLSWDHGEGGLKETSINIYAQDAVSPGTFTSADNNITGRSRTSNYVPMDISVEGDGTNVTSPDLSGLVQSVVNTHNGISHMVLIFISPNDDGDETKITSYEDSWDDANKDTPNLVVNYSYPTGYSQHSTTFTDGNGLYSFNSLNPGDYYVEFELLDDHTFSPQDAGVPNDDANDSDANETTGLTIETTLISGDNDPTWDAGMHSDDVRDIGDFVWNDLNHDGVQDAGEAGLNGVTITLYDGSGTYLEETITSNDTGGNPGWYEFDNLPAGSYTVTVDWDGFKLLYPDLIWATYDYDGIESEHTATFTLGPDANNLDIDFGYSDTPLPVQLSRFSGEIVTDGVKLTWITKSEKENQGYIIQRKIDSEEDWLEIANFIKNPGLRGQGSVSYQTKYEYIDSSVLSGHTYQYRLGDVDYNAAIMYHTNLSFSIEVTLTAIPDKFSLNAAYPNPFNPITTITYNIPESVNVKLYIYNVNGNLVKKLINNIESPGIKKVIWNGKNDQGIDVPSGMYIYSIVAGKYNHSKKILLVK